jgi:ribonucleoside-diphosphate reductase alpha chain
MTEALGRMISIILRLQSPTTPREKIRQIVAQLAGIGGARTVGFGENRVRSVPDAVAKVLAEQFGFSVNGVVKDIQKKGQIMGNGMQAQQPPASPLSNGNGQANGVSGAMNGVSNGASVPNGVSNGIQNGVSVPSSVSNGAPSQAPGNIQVTVATQVSQPQAVNNGIAQAPTVTVMEQLSISEPTHNAFDLCPSCGGATLAHEEGCKKCYSCGYSEC